MTTAVLVLARTLHIGSAMMLVALPYFMLVILKPIFAADTVQSYDSFCLGVIKGLWGALILEAVSGFVWFWFVTAQMSDQSPWGILDEADLSAVLWQTQFGQLWLGRAAVGVALGVALCFVSRKKARASLQPSRLNWLVLAISGLLLITLAWAGHGASGIHYHVLHLVADTLHLLIGAIWPLGLIPMVCFLWYVHRRNQIVPADREIKALQRFSQISLVAVLLIVATGIINGWLMVGSWEAMVTTTYGRLLLGKVVVVGIMIGLGAFNRLYLLPRMQANPILFRTLRRTILAESGLALVVLFIVGTMGMTAPPS
jgi:putative copper resistance protein D